MPKCIKEIITATFPHRNLDSVAAVTIIPSTTDNTTIRENVAGLNAYYLGQSTKSDDTEPQDITWTGYLMRFKDRQAHPVEANTGDMYVPNS